MPGLEFRNFSQISMIDILVRTTQQVQKIGTIINEKMNYETVF